MIFRKVLRNQHRFNRLKNNSRIHTTGAPTKDRQCYSFSHAVQVKSSYHNNVERLSQTIKLRSVLLNHNLRIDNSPVSGPNTTSNDFVNAHIRYIQSRANRHIFTA